MVNAALQHVGAARHGGVGSSELFLHQMLMRFLWCSICGLSARNGAGGVAINGFLRMILALTANPLLVIVLRDTARWALQMDVTLIWNRHHLPLRLYVPCGNVMIWFGLI
jgi:hypothetical protein